jgi:hypothetical protein
MQEGSGNRKIDPTGLARSSVADPSPRSLYSNPRIFHLPRATEVFPGEELGAARHGPACFPKPGAGPVVAERRGVAR